MCPGKLILPIFALSFTVGGVFGYLYSPFRLQTTPVIDVYPASFPLAEPKTAPPTPQASEDVIPFSCKEMDPQVKIQLNFQRVSLLKLVELVSAYTCQNFIISERVPLTEFTLISPEPVSVSDLNQAFEAVLALEGLALVPAGEFIQIVREQEAQRAGNGVRGMGYGEEGRERGKGSEETISK